MLVEITGGSLVTAGETMAETTEPRVGIDEFVKGLRAIPDFRPDIVYSYIKAHPVQPDSP